MTSGQFFAAYITPGSFGMLFAHCHTVVFQDNCASLRQLNSPNGRDKFQICFINIYLIRMISNEFRGILHVFAGFCGFT